MNDYGQGKTARQEANDSMEALVLGLTVLALGILSVVAWFIIR